MGRQNVPRSHVEPPDAGAGENGSTLAELSRCARTKLSTERVENNTPLSSGRNDAIDESAPITKKRRKIAEKAEDNSRSALARNVTCRQIEVSGTIKASSSINFMFPFPSPLILSEPHSGAFEENIRELFSKAYMRAPSIVFIDDIDAMTSKKENLLKEIEPRIVNQLMSCMDESCRLIKSVNHNIGSESSNSTPGYVLVIGATSRPEDVDPALRQLFDHEIVLGVPDENARLAILSVLTCNLNVEVSCDLSKIARCTMGFVGGDLAALAKMAGILAVNRIMDQRNIKISKEPDGSVTIEDIEGNPRSPFSDEEMEKFSITMADFEHATRMVQPSSKMEEFYTIPNAKWSDVVGLQLLKQEFDCHIVRPIKFPDVYKDLGMNSTTTFFLYGPSGCGKTLIVEALANEAGANFIHIKCPELLNKYADHSKLVLGKIFSNARTWSPCILFFDEVEALATFEAHDVLMQVVFKLEDAEERRSVYIICATNRLYDVNYLVFYFSTINKGRFVKYMYVPPPSPEERGMVLKALAGNKPIDADVDLMALGKDVACENFSGADLCTLMKEAARGAIDRRSSVDGGGSLPIAWTIKDADFKRALEKISPTISPMNLADYRSFSERVVSRTLGSVTESGRLREM